MSQNPTVSICLPVYNGEKFLAQAIESVVRQSFTDFELLIIDDCSSDRSPEVIEQFRASEKRIRYIKNAQNLGLFNNYNECIKQATGHYIKLFAQDDIFHPNILERMVDVLKKRPEVALISCTKGWVGEHGERIEAGNEMALRTLRPFDVDTQKPAEEAILDSFQRFVNWLGEPSTVMFRNEHKSSGFDVRFRQIGDLEYWYRILQNGDYYFLSDELCRFRKHAGSTTNRNGRSLSALLDWFLLGSKYRYLIPKQSEPETEDEFSRRLTRRLIKTIATRFALATENPQLDTVKVMQQLTDHGTVLSCFATENDTRRDPEAEYKVFAICALREGANMHNEVRILQNRVEHQEQQITDLQMELDDVRFAFDSEISELQTKLNQLGNSLSWKVTAPLRGFKRLLK
jgi:glycosyltransferase involved in cell wall biosynthesis